jgi:hypothetical protein
MGNTAHRVNKGGPAGHRRRCESSFLEAIIAKGIWSDEPLQFQDESADYLSQMGVRIENHGEHPYGIKQVELRGGSLFDADLARRKDRRWRSPGLPSNSASLGNFED